MTRPKLLPHALILLLALALPTALLSGCGGDGSTTADGDSPADWSGADDKARFRLATLDGAELGPPDFAGDVVLVDFWATWCVPCHAQAEVLHDVYADLEGDGVQFLAVNVGEEESTVRGFVEKSPFPYPVLLDPQSRLADELGVFSLPTLMVIDPAGGVAYFRPGLVSEGDLREILSEAAAGGAAGSTETAG